MADRTVASAVECEHTFHHVGPPLRIGFLIPFKKTGQEYWEFHFTMVCARCEVEKRVSSFDTCPICLTKTSKYTGITTVSSRNDSSYRSTCAKCKLIFCEPKEVE